MTLEFDGVFHKSNCAGNISHEYQRREYRKRREYYLKKAKLWASKNRERIRKNNRLLEVKLKNLVFEKLGGKCNRCGFDDVRALQIDHIGGGGTSELKTMRGREYYKKVFRDRENKYQVLCANCNWIKRCEKEEGNPILEKRKERK